MKSVEKFKFYDFFKIKNTINMKNPHIIKKLKSGELLYSQGEKCEELTMLVKGQLDIVKYFFNGKEQKMGEISEKELFGGVLLFNEDVYPANIIAKNDSEILKISKKNLLELFKNEDFLVAFLKEMSNKMVNLSNLIEILSYSKIVDRVSKYILMKYEKEKNLKLKLETKTEIAKKIGSSREVVSRAFKKLKEQNIIKEFNGEIEILSLEKLEKIFI